MTTSPYLIIKGHDLRWIMVDRMTCVNTDEACERGTSFSELEHVQMLIEF